MSDPEPFAPFIVRRLWHEGPAPADRWRERLRGVLRIGYAVVRDVVDGRLPLHAASLVYTTILSLVPLTALAFSVLKGFGVHYRFEELLMSGLAPLGREAPVIAERLLAFVDKMDVRVLGAVGLALLFYTAIAVVQKVEAAFADIWHVDQVRPWARKFTDYLSVLLIGPVLMFAAFGIGASVLASEPVRQLSEIRPIWVLIETGQRLLPFLLVVCTFVFLYKFLPYTRVSPRAAAIGGVVAGAIWMVAGWAFALFVQGATSYTAIYSAFASLILFIIWLDVNWLILLIGAAIAFYCQHPEYMPLAGGRTILSVRSRERLALAAMRAIGRAYYAGERPPSADELRIRLRVPHETVMRVLNALITARLLATTKDEPPRFLPARPLETTPLKTLLDAVRAAGERSGLELGRIAADQPVLAVETRIEEAIGDALHGLHLKDLVVAETGPDINPPDTAHGANATAAEHLDETADVARDRLR